MITYSEGEKQPVRLDPDIQWMEENLNKKRRPSYQERFELALLYKERGHIDKACKLFQDLYMENDDFPPLLIELANLYFASGLPDYAAELYYRALDTEKLADPLGTMVQLALCFYRMDGQFKPRSQEMVYGKRRMYIHFYYNEQLALDERKQLYTLLDQLETELLEGTRKPEHEKAYAKYFDVTTKPNTVISTVKESIITEQMKNYGYFVLVSNAVKDPVEALHLYRNKDLIEKAFGDLKERLDMRRTSVFSEENLEGKLFVQFVALYYLSYIKKAMTDHDLFKQYTIQELLDELDIIEVFIREGKQPQFGEITQKQKNLYTAMGVETPT